MERVAAPEDLEVAGAEIEGAHPVATAFEDRLDGVEALVADRTDRRHVLEQPTFVGFVDEHGDGELVRVEVPGELLAGIEDVRGEPGERIGVAVQRRDLETGGEERSELGGSKQHVDRAARVPTQSPGMKPLDRSMNVFIG